ncbi:DUF1648 domain-containing protein [Lysinibacillus antri]|uniref:DUF1648 domain-containing protein n=1 Tax=Lysinibacillus antri TaxID=2498145 RepID=A0A3S0WIM2_9BACI|nr:DUF1648 domain-containing protein [Lysinibacillus antri]RUL56899.1 DUF1648 domain-containing protein [Lysinibacillus antri]
MNNKLLYRPILKLPKTKVEKIMDAMGLGIFLLAILFLIVNWGNIPEEVPGHFNATGEVDRWGSKVEVIILPIIGTFLFMLMSAFEKAPHMHNYPKRINETNAYQFYTQSTRLLNVVKNLCLVMFAFLIVQIVRVSLGDIQSLGLLFLPVFLIILFGVMISGIYKQSKIK